DGCDRSHKLTVVPQEVNHRYSPVDRRFGRVSPHDRKFIDRPCEVLSRRTSEKERLSISSSADTPKMMQARGLQRRKVGKIAQMGRCCPKCDGVEHTSGAERRPPRMARWLTSLPHPASLVCRFIRAARSRKQPGMRLMPTNLENTFVGERAACLRDDP